MSTPFQPNSTSTDSSSDATSYQPAYRPSADSTYSSSSSDETQAVRSGDATSFYSAPSYATSTDYSAPYSGSTYSQPSSSADSPYGTAPASSSDTVLATPVVVVGSDARQQPSGGSRALAGFASLLIGLLLVAGGVELLGRFGTEIRNDVLADGITPGWVTIALAGLGALALFAATLLNGWSPWATLLPGLALAVVGAWAVVSPDFLRQMSDGLDRVLPRETVAEWGAQGWFFGLGLVLLGASGAAVIARSAGRTRGRP